VKSALPNSTYTLASGSTSAITPNSTFAQDSTVGEVIVGINAGADITLGQLVYLRHSGDWHIADASSTSTSLKILGIALKSVNGGDPVDVLIDGVISMDSTYLTVSSIGESLYVDTTAGKITNTAPSGGGEVVRIVGHYIKAETGYSIITFKPDGTWIEL
jgi:predicted RecA/RadA family phage recombinase